MEEGSVKMLAGGQHAGGGLKQTQKVEGTAKKPPATMKTLGSICSAVMFHQQLFAHVSCRSVISG